MSVCVAIGSALPCEKRKKKKKKDEDFEATCIPQADISPSTDVMSLFLPSFLSVLGRSKTKASYHI